MSEPRSIHHRRRWFYVLWAAFLALALVGLALWRTPVLLGTWNLQIQMAVNGAPGPVQAQIWFGPESQVRSGDLQPPWIVRTLTLLPGKKLAVQDLRVPVLKRRWTRAPFPERNGEILVLILTSEKEAPRYAVISLKDDLLAILPRNKRVTMLNIVTEWKGLPLEPAL